MNTYLLIFINLFASVLNFIAYRGKAYRLLRIANLIVAIMSMAMAFLLLTKI
jgi:hypothetical protein